MVAPLLKGSKAYPSVVIVEATVTNGLAETRGIHLEQMRVDLSVDRVIRSASLAPQRE
jgi:hypothetical protein